MHFQMSLYCCKQIASKIEMGNERILYFILLPPSTYFNAHHKRELCFVKFQCCFDAL